MNAAGESGPSNEAAVTPLHPKAAGGADGEGAREYGGVAGGELDGERFRLRGALLAGR